MNYLTGWQAVLRSPLRTALLLLLLNSLAPPDAFAESGNSGAYSIGVETYRGEHSLKIKQVASGSTRIFDAVINERCNIPIHGRSYMGTTVNVIRETPALEFWGFKSNHEPNSANIDAIAVPNLWACGLPTQVVLHSSIGNFTYTFPDNGGEE